MWSPLEYVRQGLGRLIAGEDILSDVQKVELRGVPSLITTATTTTLKSGPGHITTIRCAGGVLGNVTIYDNTAAAGTVLYGPLTPAAGIVLLESCEFSVGLTIVTAAATHLTASVR